MLDALDEICEKELSNEGATEPVTSSLTNKEESAMDSVVNGVEVDQSESLTVPEVIVGAAPVAAHKGDKTVTKDISGRPPVSVEDLSADSVADITVDTVKNYFTNKEIKQDKKELVKGKANEHHTKAAASKEERQAPKRGPAFGSKKEEQIAKIKEFLRNPEDENGTEVAIPKVRFKKTGKQQDNLVS